MLHIKKLLFSYCNNAKESCINVPELWVKKGECVVLCGKSGCGKTTLLRSMNGLVPHFYEGDFSGDVLINGESISTMELSNISMLVGSVFQNPRTQFFHTDTTGELAFNLENRGIKREEILERISEIVDTMDISKLKDRNIFELSGGEKQQIACASVYASKPPVIVMDEPSSNLDMAGIYKLIQMIERLLKEGVTIIISEHRLWYLENLANRYLYLEDGKISREFTREQMVSFTSSRLTELGLRVPSEERLHQLGKVNDRKTVLNKNGNNMEIDLRNMICKRGKRTILDIPKLTLPPGAIIAIIGENGAGKSTFSLCLSGLLKCKGKMKIGQRNIKKANWCKESYLVMQEAGYQLFCENVLEELMLGQGKEKSESAKNLLKHLNLYEQKECHPASLSGGQKQRVALATAFCAGRNIMIYDEPTSGQDGENLLNTIKLIRDLNESSIVSLVISHDPEFIIHCATHLLHIEAGKVKKFRKMNQESIDYMWGVFERRV